MNLTAILRDLRNERDAIDKAIAVVEQMAQKQKLTMKPGDIAADRPATPKKPKAGIKKTRLPKP